jgi:transcriptional regulator with XRE-family HTH domain
VSSIHTKSYKQFLVRLNSAREQAGLTQVEVSKLLDKPQSFVAKCENGDRKVDAIELLQFSKLYQVPVDYFFEGVEL